MASVWLERPLNHEDDLPDVCARCGAETKGRVKRNFNWIPPWVIITILAGLLIYLILAIILKKNCSVAVPMCDKHRNHWFGRGLWVFLTFLLFIGGSIGLTVLTVEMVPNGELEGLAALWIVAGILAWLIFIIVANYTAIRPLEITDDRIRLTGVSEEFASAYREHLDKLDRGRREVSRGGLDRWDDRPKRRPRRDDDDRYERDDDRPRRDRIRDEDY
jgi:hypothetical protein